MFYVSVTPENGSSIRPREPYSHESTPAEPGSFPLGVSRREQERSLASMGMSLIMHMAIVSSGLSYASKIHSYVTGVRMQCRLAENRGISDAKEAISRSWPLPRVRSLIALYQTRHQVAVDLIRCFEGPKRIALRH